MFQIKTGVISKDTISHLDFVLSAQDDNYALAPLRSVLREKLPKPLSGTMHHDLRYLLDKYTKGVIYKIDKPSEEMGKSQIPIGKVLFFCCFYVSAIVELHVGQGPIVQN